MSVPVAYQRLDHLCNARAALSVDLARIIDGRAIGAWGSIFGARRGDHGCARRCQRSSGPARQIGVMQDSAPSTASELGAVLGRGGKETDPHGVSSILWTHLVREPRRKTIRAQKKESDGGHLERSEALARRKVSFLQRQGDTDLHASVRSKAVTDACVTELIETWTASLSVRRTESLYAPTYFVLHATSRPSRHATVTLTRPLSV
jgi:hypothetical protein